MEKVWLKNYPPNIPPDINLDRFQSLVEIFEQRCRLFANRPAFYNFGTTLTYQQLESHSRLFATYLQQVLKLKKGDRLAVMLPNVLQYPVVIFGAMLAGVIVVNVNPLYTVPELIHQINDAGAESIIVLSSFAKTVQDALPKTLLKNVIVTEMGDFLSPFKAFCIYVYLKYFKRKIPQLKIPHAISFKKALKKAEKFSFQPVSIKQHDIAFLQYTGGTTGLSKGAMLTHHNLIANILQGDAWFKNIFRPGQEIVVTALPLYHIFSLLANCLVILKVGGCNVLITNPRDMRHMVAEMAKFKFTVITGVNTLFNGLLNDAGFQRLDFSALRLSLGGGAAVQQAIAEKWQALTGCVLLEAYGLTETSPCVCINPSDLKSYNGTVGLPVSSTDICIFDDDGHELTFDQPGELAVKGPQVMRGYWNNPQETEKTFTKDHWLLTGDIASVDEKGFVRILERKKDMIIVSGFNVYPNEVEDALVKIPGIIEAAVIGIPDDKTGEAVKAYIVKDAPGLSEEDILQYCKTMLTGYKLPRHIEFRKELPKTNVGKILRRALK